MDFRNSHGKVVDGGENEASSTHYYQLVSQLSTMALLNKDLFHVLDLNSL